jgi:hypothetical protein
MEERTMKRWFEDKFRRTLLDMHIEDWDENFLSEYDPDAYFRALKKAKISAAMIYVQSHVGLCYWPTKSGDMHRAFTGKENAVKRLFSMCRNEGINTILYYSVIFNNREYEKHPEWRMRDRKNRGSREFGGRYGLCCPNNEHYRDFVRTQIGEFSDYFDFDGVFFDMTFWPEVCYCDSCRERWMREADEEMPVIVNWKNPVWRRFDGLRHQWIGEFADLLTNEVKKLKPEVSVEHQYGNSMAYWRFGNNENVSLASDYIGTDLYGGIKEQAFACKAWYNLTRNQPFQYMTSRCFPSLAEHTTTKSFDQLRQCVGMTCLHHGAPLLIDAIDPAGTIDERVYDIIGKVYDEVISIEPYMARGKMAWDVSLYFDLNGKMDIETNGYDVLDHALNRDARKAGTMPHYDALRGAADSLARHHVPYGIINNWKFDEMYSHRALILSDVPDMQDDKARAILDYIEKGGNVYVSGHISPVLLKTLFSAEWDGYTDETITYMTPVEGCDVMHGLYTVKYPLIMFERAAKIHGDIKGEILATLTLPYTKPGISGSMFPTDIFEEDYIDIKDSRFSFASIHSNPPGIPTDQPALLRTQYGKGTALWSALPIERADRFQHSEIFVNIVRTLTVNNLQFRADCPDSVEIVLFDVPDYKQKLLGVIETRQEARICGTHDIRIYLTSGQRPAAVTSVYGTDIPFTYKEGELGITLDVIDIYTMLVIQY